MVMIWLAFVLFALLIVGWAVAPNGMARRGARVEAANVRLRVRESTA
jgi:hypothetical protein